MTDGPEPGVYHNVPFDEYCNWVWMSHSTLKWGLVSMEHLRAAVDGLLPIPDTNAMRIGRLLHAGVLEPLTMLQDYVVMPRYELDSENKTKQGKPTESKATSYYKERVAEFEEVNASKQIVLKSEYETIAGVAAKIASDERCQSYLTNGVAEVSFVWDDPETGVRCKGRADYWQASIGLVVDLKKHDNPKPFTTVMANLNYHQQLAFYADGLALASGKEVNTGVLVAIESEPPFSIQAAPITGSCWYQGRKQYKEEPEWAHDEVTIKVGGKEVTI